MTRMEIGFGSSDPNRSWNDVVEMVRHAEALGFDSFCMRDHPSYRGIDCHTALAAIAATTTKIKLWPLTLAIPWRPPSLIAKTMASLDVISNGRLMLGLGTGWKEEEFRAYGFPFESKSVRNLRLGEAIQIIRTMWTEESATFEGRTWSVRDAVCEPKPVQKPHPPIWVGSWGGLRTMREIVAPLADGWNFGMPAQPPFEASIAALRDACESIGRDPNEVSLSVNLQIEGAKPGAPPEGFHWRHVDGGRFHPTAMGWKTLPLSEPDQIVERIDSLFQLGVTHFMLLVRSDAILDDLTDLAKNVLTRLR